MSAIRRAARILADSRRCLVAALLGVLGLLATTAQAREPVAAELMTVAPGEIYWERFGHNALIVSFDDGSRTSYNFGYFDFDQPGFLVRFLRGHMLYLAVAIDAAADLDYYLQSGRSIRLQRLDLDRQALSRLAAHLERAVAPDEREYRYDYYTRNCSTKIRDALDVALDGALKRATISRSRGLSYRDFTLSHAAPVPWLYVGTHLGLSEAVDRPISLWSEQFLPARVADVAAELRNAEGDGPLVQAERFLGPAWPDPPAFPERMPWWLLAGAALAGMISLPGRVGRSAAVLIGAGFGLIGLALLGLWLGTEHWAAHRNENMLLYSPLWLLALPALAGRTSPTSQQALRWALATAAAAVAAKVLPAFGQQNWEWIALAAPPMLLLAWRVWWRPSSSRR